MITFDFTKTPITQVADTIIINGAKMNASDIHLDPRESGLIIRYRIDGDLIDYAFVPKVYERNLSTRLKLLANMNITETRLPQDGAIKGKFGDLNLDMRVSSLPTNEGEKIVIRILDYSMSLSGIDKLGFNKTNFEKLKRMISVPNGIILVTGATGSGKSTTVYSILQVLNKEETNIITVEDPIEMNIEGMNQVQVNSDIGLTFATVLRSILRQDPNIILIGEIRDSETAQIAVRASITGHLVLSTIHTNNSLSTIERLLDMNVERYLLSSAFTGIISQRLAKMICPHCKHKRPTNLYEKKVFKLALNKDINEIYDANHNGCNQCNKGYHGRIAIQEVLEIDEEIRNTINNPKLDRENLRNLVYGSNHVITMLQDGLEKVLEGFTSFEEIYRIIEIDNDIEDSYNEQIPNNLTIEELDSFMEKRRKDIEELKTLYVDDNSNNNSNINVSAIIPANSINKQIADTGAVISKVQTSATTLPTTSTIIPNPNLNKLKEQTQTKNNSTLVTTINTKIQDKNSTIIPNPNLNKQILNNNTIPATNNITTPSSVSNQITSNPNIPQVNNTVLNVPINNPNTNTSNAVLQSINNITNTTVPSIENNKIIPNSTNTNSNITNNNINNVHNTPVIKVDNQQSPLVTSNKNQPITNTPIQNSINENTNNVTINNQNPINQQPIAPNLNIINNK